MNRLKSLKPAVTLVLTLISTSSAAYAWDTEVHNLMIDLAFPKESAECRNELKRGSREVDNHQGEGDSYMHAMRGPKETEAAAIEKTWTFVDRNYGDAHRAPKAVEACYFRGRALHPIMDGTSPAHHGYQSWQPLSKPSQLFRHGSISSLLKPFLPEFLDALIPGSHEDSGFIDDHPQYLRTTVDLMKAVDSFEIAISQK